MEKLVDRAVVITTCNISFIHSTGVGSFCWSSTLVNVSQLRETSQRKKQKQKENNPNTLSLKTSKPFPAIFFLWGFHPSELSNSWDPSLVNPVQFIQPSKQIAVDWQGPPSWWGICALVFSLDFLSCSIKCCKNKFKSKCLLYTVQSFLFLFLTEAHLNSFWSCFLNCIAFTTVNVEHLIIPQTLLWEFSQPLLYMLSSFEAKLWSLYNPYIKLTSLSVQS